MSLTDMMLSLTNMLPRFACYDHLVAAKRLGMFVDLSVIADLRLRVEHRHFVKEDAVRAAVKPRLHFGKDSVEVPAAVSRCSVDEHLNAAFVQPVHHLGLQVDKAGGSIVGLMTYSGLLLVIILSRSWPSLPSLSEYQP
jgi:hypothetical protein